MKLDECIKCEFHVEHLPDSILCKYSSELESRVLSTDNVVGCPKPAEKKSLRDFFRK